VSCRSVCYRGGGSFWGRLARDLIRTHEIKPDIEAIQKTIADFFHMRLADLKSEKRTQHIAFCRQVAMSLCRKMTDSSFPAIGEAFGRDHSTLIHAHNLIARRIVNDSAFRFSIEKIERELSHPRQHIFVRRLNSVSRAMRGR
jgi:chromosomal replication initiator protein